MACTAVQQETIPKTRNGNVLTGMHRILKLEELKVLIERGGFRAPELFPMQVRLAF